MNGALEIGIRNGRCDILYHDRMEKEGKGRCEFVFSLFGGESSSHYS